MTDLPIDRMTGENRDWLIKLAREEYPALRVVQRIVLEQQPMLAVELGTLRGAGTAMIALAMPRAGHTITIDNKKFDCPDEEVEANLERLNLNDKVTRIVGNSEECDTLIRKVTYLPVDFCYIDAWHTYTACKADYEAISKVLAPKHIVVLDDVNLGNQGHEQFVSRANPSHGDGVFVFIAELFPKYQYMEYYNVSNGVMACFVTDPSNLPPIPGLRGGIRQLAG